MTGLDTNLVLRYLLQDDPAQSATVSSIMEQLTESDPGFLSIVVILETVWALLRIYGYSHTNVVLALEHLLQIDALVIQHKDEVYAATSALKAGVGSFHDALIDSLGQSEGCAHTLTFDRKALRLSGFKLIS
jgi:predicted nucleic-acid-binding protein